MQNVVRIGEDYVFAEHQDLVDITGLYPALTLDPPLDETGLPTGPPVTVAAGEVVQVPYDFKYAYDELGRKLDPRRFAGEGGTPLGP